jgi:outer membrane protein
MSALRPGAGRRSVVVLSALLSIAGVSSPAVALDDLLSVYVHALDGNPDYASAVAAFHQAEEQKPQALAKLLPQVAAGADIDAVEQAISGRYFVDTFAAGNGQGVESNHRDQFYEYNYQVGLTQVLFHKDLLVSLDQAELEVGRAGVQIAAAQDELRLAVAQGYFEALGADDEVRFASAEVDAIGKLLGETRDKRSAGLTTDVEVDQVEAQYAAAQATQINAHNTRDISRVQLQLLTGGTTFSALRPLAGTYLPEPPDPNRMDVWVDRATTQNIALQAQRIGTEVALKGIEKARAARLPTLDAIAARNYGYADGGVSKGIGAGNNHDLDERVLLKLKIPIYTGGAIDSAIRAAVAGYARAQADEASARNKAVGAVQQAFLNSAGGASKVKALKSALAAAVAAEDTTRSGYEVGTRTSAEVLLAVQNRYKAERDYAASRYDYLLNSLKLRQAAGTLNHADLLAINRSLQ